ncbi:hypothetical protein AB0G73_13575 [Streptomyces sp. NPDC020719]|uniref:hypothetical protein n=1 Tax=Streptomyces sp. NPDC020719 TaxID=3154896 RepID=UPI0033C93AB0
MIVVLAGVGEAPPAGRLLDHAPAAGTDQDTHLPATVHIECDRSEETHIRALLLQALTASGLPTTGLRARRSENTAGLRATVLVDGDVTRALEQVVTRLSLEPGIRDLHWHLDATADNDTGRNQPALDPTPRPSAVDYRCAAW